MNDIKKISVLLVEDNPGDVRLIREYLMQSEDVSFDITIRSTAAEALEFLLANCPDVVLLDIQLPDSAGLDTLYKINRLFPSLPIVILTGISEKEFALTALQHGAQDYLPKNQITAELLVRSLLYSIERKQAAEKIKKIGQHYHALIEKAPDGIVLVSQEGKFVYVSPSALKMFGYITADELKGDPAKYTHPDDLDMVLEELNKLILDPSYSPTIQYRFHEKNGNWKWIESTFSNLIADPAVQAIVINFRDISERVQTLDALQASKAYLDNIINSVSLPIFVKDDKHNYCLVNDASCTMLGVLPEDLIGTTGGGVFTPDLNKKFLTSDDDVLETGRENVNEEVFVDAQGVTRTLIIKKTVVTDSKGSRFIVGVINDITDIKQAENVIRESELRYRSLFKYFPSGILVMDEKGTILEANEEIEKSLLYSNDELVGSNVKKLTITDETEKISKDIEKLLSGKMLMQEVVNKRKDGSLCTLLLKEIAIKLPDGKQGILSVSNDITARVQAEKSLRESEILFSTTFHFLPTPISISDVENEEWVEVNDAFLKATGYSRQEVIGHTFHELNLWKHPEDREMMRKTLAEQGMVRDIEVDINKKDGTTGTMQLSVTKVDLAGKPYLLIVGVEITERKLARIALEKSEEKYRMLADNVTDIVWLLDFKTQRFTYISPAIEKIRGYTPEEALALSFSETLRPENYKLAMKDMMEALKKDPAELRARGRVVTYEFDEFHKNGSIVSTETNIQLLFDKDGNPSTLIGVTRDITKRKQAEIQLKESESSMRYAQEIAKMGSWEWNMVSHKVKWSDNYYAFLGFNPANDVPSLMLYRSRIYPPDIAYFDETYLYALEKKKPVDFVIRVVQKDGTIRWTQNNVVPLVQDNKIVKLKGIFIDITERKEAEEAIVQYNLKLEYAMKAANMAWWQMDVTSGEVIFDKRKTDFLGYSQEDFKHYKDFMALVHPDDYDKAMNAMTLHFKGAAEKYEVEYRILAKSGEYKWFYDTGTIIKKDANGLPLIINGLVIDIGNRKLAEKALFESEEKYRTIFENVQDIFYQTSIEGIVMEISPSIKHFSEFNRDDMVGKPVENLYYNPSDRVRFLKALKKTGELKDFELKLKTKSGELKYVSINARLIFDSNGKPQHIDGALRDITERKEIENVLNNIILKNPMSIQIINKDGYTISVNPAHAALFGSMPPPDFSVFNDLQRMGFDDELERAKKGEVVHIPDVLYNTRDVSPEFPDKPVWLHAILFPLTDNSKSPERFVIMHENITDPKHAEEVVQNAYRELEKKVVERTAELAEANQKLQSENERRQQVIEREQEVNLMKTRFISVISHEFRTPLTGIFSNIQLLELYGDKWDNEKKKKFFLTVYNSIRFINLLLDDVSIIGNAESGNLSFNPTCCKIEEICLQAITDIKAVSANSNKINFSIEPAKIHTFADDSLLRHILNNLLSNAVKYSKDQQEIDFSVTLCDDNELIQEGTIRDNCVHTEPVSYSHAIVFTITDHGIGIPEEDQNLLFEPFHRATNVESIKGTGLGLSIVQSCVEKHEGSIKVSSIVNKGTTVVVKIPCREPEEK